MNSQELFNQIQKKRSFLCVGLDTDIKRLPAHLLSESDPVFSFNKAIIDAVAPYSVALKPNLAFYESDGIRGLTSLEKTLRYSRSVYPELFLIADAKRGDIGNTSELYARAFFDQLDFDAITLSPYMGADTVSPFLRFADKWVILLALTSNPSSSDFQTLIEHQSGKMLYEKVIEQSRSWGTLDNTMYVVGATQSEKLQSIRALIPDHFLLIPGVGEQGGSLSDVARYGMNRTCGLLVNSSRSIIYADSSELFASASSTAARELATEMSQLLDKYLL